MQTHFISHRRNTLDELVATPREYGIEVDIRSIGERLVIHHEPFMNGELFEDWLTGYQHGTLILNVKEEGLESELIALMQRHCIENFFFLDQSFPFLVKWAKAGESRCAVRVSEYESVEAALTLAGKIDWVWVDCFERFPLNGNDAKRLQHAGFKLCLVSPELHGRSAEEEIPSLIKFLEQQSIRPEAICTKRVDLWQIAPE